MVNKIRKPNSTVMRVLKLWPYLTVFGLIIYVLFFHSRSVGVNKMKQRFTASPTNPGTRQDSTGNTTQNFPVTDSVRQTEDDKHSLLQKVTPAAVGKIAHKGFSLSNTTEQQDIIKMLRKNGVRETHAVRYSSKVQKSMASKIFKRSMVFVTVIGFVMTAEEFLCESLTFTHRIIIASGFGLLILLLYIKAVRKDVME